MRRIDPKFHISGDEIIKTSNGQPVPEDEPLFLLRGRDHLAVLLLKLYLLLSERDDCTDFHLDGVRERIEAFEKFRDQHPVRMKQPGVTRGL